MSEFATEWMSEPQHLEADNFLCVCVLANCSERIKAGEIQELNQVIENTELGNLVKLMLVM